jgi:Tol biopolymer transport system component
MRALLLILVACSSTSRPPPRTYGLPADDRPEREPHGLPKERPESEPGEIARDPEQRDADPPQIASGAVDVKQLAAASTGHFVFTKDARWLLYLASDGIHVVRTQGLAGRVIPSSAPWFVVTPDSRWILHGARIERTSIDGGAPKRLAPELELHSLSHVVVSPDSKWIAFVASTGELAIASIDGGPAKRLPVDPPEDARCHAGAGFVRTFSADSQWLVYQHGCTTNEAIRIDGTARHVIEPAMRGIEVIAGPYSLGVGNNRFTITPLAGGAIKHVETPPLFGFSGPKVAPDQQSFAFIAEDYSLHVVDLATLRLDRVSPKGVGVSSFIEHTPDSQRVLYASAADGRCELRMFDRIARRDVGLGRLAEGGQCFIKAAGNQRAVIHTWRRVDRGYTREILLVDLETRAIQSLVRDGDVGNYDVSPDGRLVAFTGGRPQWPISVIVLP